MIHQFTAIRGEAWRASRGWARTLLVLLALASVAAAAAVDLYVETAIDPSGQLHITTKRKKEIVPKKQKDQTGFYNAQISPDEKAIGWLALYPNCCGPFPVALKLVILVNGEERTFAGTGLPIARWCFFAAGKQAAFEQETVEGGMGVHYELHGVATGELADKYDPDSNPDSVTKPPRWVVVLDSTR